MVFKNILVPFDSSSLSKKSFKIALEMAQQNDAVLFVLTVIQGPYLGKPYKDKLVEKGKAPKSEYEKAEKLMDELQEEAEKKGIKINSEIKYDESIVGGILKFADSKKIDLIVVGSRGRTGFKKLLLGSVSTGLSQHASCPVLIVR